MMTLKEHDFRYHHGDWERDKARGATCLFRERLEAGDNGDDALNDANEKEAAAYYGKIHEKESIANAFCDNIPMLKNARIRKRNGAVITVLDQEPNGNRKVVISCFPMVKDDEIDPKVAKKFIEGKSVWSKYGGRTHTGGLGYELKSIESKTVRSPNIRNGGKKMFIFNLYNPNIVGAISNKRDGFVVTHSGRDGGEMSEAAKSAALSRYGKKVEGGKVVNRNGRRDMSDAERYLKMVDAGGTALKNRTNAEIKKDMDEQKASESDERDAFMRELGIA